MLLLAAMLALLSPVLGLPRGRCGSACCSGVPGGATRGVLPWGRRAGGLRAEWGQGGCPPQLLADIKSYMEARRGAASDDDSKDSVFVPVSEWRRGKFQPTEPFGIAKGTGFFKDKFELDLRSRSDGSRPFVPHPLSFAELERFGFGRLSDAIVALGGPEVVGKLADIGWAEPKLEFEKEPESSRPRREESFALNLKGELVLGGGLEDRLAAAENLDLAQVKAAIDGQKLKLGAEAELKTPGPGAAGPDYGVGSRRQSKSAASSPLPTSTTTSPLTERFSLDGLQRLFLVATAGTLSVAHGRASADILANHYWGSAPTLGDSGVALDAAVVDLCSVLSLALISASVMSAVGSAYLAPAESKLVWGLMGLLGGPVGISKLRSRGGGGGGGF